MPTRTRQCIFDDLSPFVLKKENIIHNKLFSSHFGVVEMKNQEANFLAGGEFFSHIMLVCDVRLTTSHDYHGQTVSDV